jgi:tetraprenyl-beta-curcumene synthase
MAGMKLHHISQIRDMFALIRAGITYWFIIVPRARHEIWCWKRYARLIPDPTLKRQALDKLSKETFNPEAAAFFTLLAPKASRSRLVRLIVTYQVMYDYLDAVNEEVTSSPLVDGLQLHRALVDAVRSDYTSADYYRYHSHYNDDGYLEALVDACRRVLDGLPSRVAITPILVAAAERCAEAQTRNHAISRAGCHQLVEWSERQALGAEYLWWEIAAAGISCLAIHALFVATATPHTTWCEANQIASAYFPPVCAISALLDSLVDLHHDADTTNHSFSAHYSSGSYAAERYIAIIADAKGRLSNLRHARLHGIILTGIIGYYLSVEQLCDKFVRSVRVGITLNTSPVFWPIVAVMRVRRRGRQLLCPTAPISPHWHAHS